MTIKRSYRKKSKRSNKKSRTMKKSRRINRHKNMKKQRHHTRDKNKRMIGGVFPHHEGEILNVNTVNALIGNKTPIYTFTSFKQGHIIKSWKLRNFKIYKIQPRINKKLILIYYDDDDNMKGAIFMDEINIDEDNKTYTIMDHTNKQKKLIILDDNTSSVSRKLLTLINITAEENIKSTSQ